MGWVDPGISEVYPENVAAAERALVSLALYEPAVAFACNLTSRQFFNPRYREVWKVAEGLFSSSGATDPITVLDAMEPRVRDAIGGLSFLSNLYSDAYSNGGGVLASGRAEIVRTAYTARELRRLAFEIPGALDAGAGLLEVVDRVRAFVDAVETGEEATSCTDLDSEIELVTTKLEASLASGKSTPTGLVTGLGLERYVPGGIPTDKLTMLFGETGTFKTAAKQWIADQVALSGRYVLDFSLEDSAQFTAERFLARHSGIPYGRIVAGDVTAAELERLKELTPRVREAAKRIIVVGNVPATIDEAVRLSRYWKRRHDIACVMLDYVQLCEMGSGTEASEIYKLCAVAQRAAHRDKIAWVLLSQMNARYENRDDKRPQLGDLYGSSGMKQLCKLAIGVYRPAKHEPVPEQNSPWHGMYHNAPSGAKAYDGALELWIRKNVIGPSDVMVPILVDPPTGRMKPVTL